VLVERYSAYFNDPSAFGFSGLRPALAYRYVYPFSDTSLGKIAYYFDHDYRPKLLEQMCIGSLTGEVEDWRKEASGRCELRSIEAGPGTIAVVDTRASAVADRHVLRPLERLLFEACDDIRCRDELHRLARERLGTRYSEDEVDRGLATFVERGLVVTSGESYLSLAVPSQAAAARDGATPNSDASHGHRPPTH